MAGEENWRHSVARLVTPVLVLTLLSAILAGCTPAGSAGLAQATPEAAPTKTAAPVDQPEGVAATAETGPQGPEQAQADENPRPAPAASAAAPLTPAPTPPEPARPRTRVIALDPGHGGPEPGASAPGLAEKDINLKIALRLTELLRAQGYEVVLTRDTDRATTTEYKGGGYPGGVARDLQARVDIANAASADLFISIHNNGSGDPGQSGTEVWYNNQRPFAERNLALARLVQENLLGELVAIGYRAVNRGIKNDSSFRIFQGRPYNIYVLGPGTGGRPHVPTQMPGVLGESLFVSNAADAAMLRQERTLDAIAAGYRDAIIAYFDLYPDFLAPDEGGSQ
ncbi:MAG: N-acetylmuramoyl-L-alanine amidase [Chloroflexi bacterium]|nr:N-acetylmuramoyl-L-alanine amidase [Chloroflexota bacterium]